MTEFGFNSLYLTKDNEPWFPVMGEMHYSRYRPELWEESLRKMKAGGVSIVSIYVIWIHHEEEEGIFDFTGCRNLKKFLELCDKVGLYVFLRLGPWVHGEVRNGGFPDWLENRKEIRTRSDDPIYLALARRYWERVFRETEGKLLKDGGPVIGVQIENEYGHVGGLQGEEGEAHMRTLTGLAKEIGFQVPLYTATGWGGAATGGLLPVMGGYCEAPWAQCTTELSPNANYVFSTLRNDSLIASDHHVSESITYDEAMFPYLTAELGGGVQVTRHRRPIATGSDIGAMSLTKLGSGVGMLGYYMYHGGSNPKGKLSTLQESIETGYSNDLPEINYDFNAPIRQYGTISDTYREIRLLATFLQDFGSDFAVLPVEIEGEYKPEDTETLRISARHDEEHGYIFINNYQRRRTMAEHKDVRLVGKRRDGDVTFPAITISDGQYAFFPYYMKLGEAVLKSAAATPFCKLDTEEGEVFVFYGDWEPEFTWEGDRRAQVLHLSRKEASYAAKVQLDKQYLILTEDFVWEEDGRLKVSGKDTITIKTYPALAQSQIPKGFAAMGTDHDLYVYEKMGDGRKAVAEKTLLGEKDGSKEYLLRIDYPEEKDRLLGRDTLLLLTYAGESMDIYLGEEKVNDSFYTGQTVPISLGYFDFPKELRLVIHPLYAHTKVYLQDWPSLSDGRACRLEKVEVEERQRI